MRRAHAIAVRAAASVIVGYGHAGRDLHFRALRCWFGVDHPIVVVDPRALTSGEPARLNSIDEAIEHLNARGLDAADAVFHVATPPDRHREIVEALVLQHGARSLIVEKPLAASLADAKGIAALARAATILPVSVWPSSAVTETAEKLVAAGEIGELRELRFEQSKARSILTTTNGVHGSAFEVELPHQVPLALLLAGPLSPGGGLLSSVSWPFRAPDRTLPGLGGAYLRLRHANGTTSTLVSDLTSGSRTRRLTLTGTDGELVAEYPTSRDDDYGQIRLSGHALPTVVPDRPLTTFIVDAYAYLRGERATPPRGSLRLHVESMAILDRARASSTEIPFL
jgi:predicted dehydrogenase